MFAPTDQLPDQKKNSLDVNEHRTRLLAALPATEHRIELGGIDTAILEGGEGKTVILLHGPGESSLCWMRVIPGLVKTHRVIVPDLPGHGDSRVTGGRLEVETVLAWLDKLVERTCPSPPVLVGHLLGGAVAARFAARKGGRIERLILANALGLGKFRPAPGFAFGLIRFLVRPSRKNYDRFLPHCMYDVEDLQQEMGEYWEPFLAYNLDCARDPERKTALRTMMQELGIPKIPSDELSQIQVPTAMIWGRHDRANKLQIAERAGKRYGWPLHVIDDARDDPKLERPEAFVRILKSILNEK